MGETSHNNDHAENSIHSRDEELYFYALSRAPGIGPKTIHHLTSIFSSAYKAYTAPLKKLQGILSEKCCTSFCTFRKSFRPDSSRQQLFNIDIHLLTPASSYWPSIFRSFSHFPVCLYTQGSVFFLNQNAVKIAIIGTRKPTRYGKQMAGIFASALSRHSLIIASGLAIGIDTCVHQTVLESNGKAIIVPGSSLDHILPRCNLRLYRALINQGALAVSEFPPGTKPSPGHFVIRNRILTALSDGVLIIEGSQTSGTLKTASYAAEQGKDVFALPGPVTSPQSYAPNMLIQQGAHLVRSPTDILDFYNIPHAELFTQDQQRILKAMQKPASIEEITLQTGLQTPNILKILARLEIDGHVKRSADNLYSATIQV